MINKEENAPLSSYALLSAFFACFAPWRELFEVVIADARANLSVAPLVFQKTFLEFFVVLEIFQALLPVFTPKWVILTHFEALDTNHFASYQSQYAILPP